MARHRAPSVCPKPGCPNDQPCLIHTPAPWANATTRRPDALRGRALQQRNARIIRRDGGRCHVCKKPGATKVDHLTPYAEGGTDDDANLAAIHDHCHASKTSSEAQRGRSRRVQ